MRLVVRIEFVVVGDDDVDVDDVVCVVVVCDGVVINVHVVYAGAVVGG